MTEYKCLTCGKSTFFLDNSSMRQVWRCGCGSLWNLTNPLKPDTAYSRLSKVLQDAQDQAQSGKGDERHASGEAFEDQPIMWIEKYFKSFQLGQAVKKLHESQRLDKDAAIRELLGAINYIAAKIILLEDKNVPESDSPVVPSTFSPSIPEIFSPTVTIDAPETFITSASGTGDNNL